MTETINKLSNDMVEVIKSESFSNRFTKADLLARKAAYEEEITKINAMLELLK